MFVPYLQRYCAPSERSRLKNPAATPTMEPRYYTPSGPPDALRAHPSPCKGDSRRFWWIACALALLSTHRASFLSTSGPGLFIDLVPAQARKTVFASLRQTSVHPFVHMHSLSKNVKHWPVEIDKHNLSA
jgi:hypothetical protein